MTTRAPMLLVALALMAGILLGEYAGVIPPWACCAAMGIGFVLMFAGSSFLRTRWTFFPGLSLAMAAMGCLLTGQMQHNTVREAATLPAEYGALQVRLLETPRLGEKCYKVPVRAEAAYCDTAWAPVGCKMMLFLPKEDSVELLGRGERLVIMGHAKRPDYVDSTTGFDYGRYLRRKGMLWQCYTPQGRWYRSSEGSASGAQPFFSKMQRRLVERLRSCGLSPQQLGIAEALLLGWRNDVDAETQQQFRKAGIMHLLCVSGLHVGLLAGIVGLMLFFLGGRLWQRVLKGTLQIASIWLFVLLTGAAPSTIRAAVMFTLMLVGNMIQGRSNSLNNLATSAVVVLLFNPMLLFDVGFQLSYSAVLGILLCQKPMRDLLPIPAGWGWWLPRKIWDWICLSTSAQMGTLPLVLLYFHQFPTYFLVANLTIVPLSGVLLATTMGVLATGGSAVFIWLLQVELSVVDGVTHWVSCLPHALIENIYCDPLIAVVLAWVLLLLAWLLRTRKVKKTADNTIIQESGR